MDGDAPITAEAIGSIRRIAAGEWDACAGSEDPFISHSFLASLEESGAVLAESGWLPRHLLLRDASGWLIGVVPCYVKSHSLGEYVFDHAWAHAWEQAGGRYYPKLQVCVPFTPVTGPRLLVRPEADHARTRAGLLAALEALTERCGTSSVHLTFLPEAEARLAEAQGFLLRTDQQFHWLNRGYESFDDFLAGLASRKRRQIRRERREAVTGGVRIETIEGADITESDWDAFFAFYLDTGSRKWGRPYLNRRFFSLIGTRMADRLLLVRCTREGRPIAGALNFKGRDALYGRWWGALEEHRFLHFEACYYRAIDYAVAHGLARVEAGAQGPHKLARGYEPVTTFSAHLFADPGFHDAIRRYLEVERRDVADATAILRRHLPFRRA